MTPPTTATLRREIDVARAEFRQLNRKHWHRKRGTDTVRYYALDDATERRIGDLAERLARLHRFAGLICSKEMLVRTDNAG